MSHPRRTFIRGAGALAASVCATPLFAQRDPAADYPNRPIKLVCPFAPAGGTDITARAIAQKLTETWGQPVFVDNKVGANGTIGVDTVVRSAPDGYTLTMISSSHSVNVTLQPHHPYDLERDLVPITQATTQPYVLVVHPALPIHSVHDLIALARQQPGKFTYGSSGIGGLSHLAGALLGSMAKIQLTHVPYKGGAPAMADVISGQIDMLFSTILQSHGHIQAGRLRPIAVSKPQRAAALPGIPTTQEAGVPGYDVAGWYGVLAPRGTPAPIITKLNGEIVRILQLQTTRERLASDGSEPVGSSPADFAKHIHAEILRWRNLIQELGIKSD
jgi:tripartite-type tricarboxylate transporter receptor subunit TctC